MLYAIVKFPEEADAPGIICCHWMNEFETCCKYPNVRTNEARDRLLKQLAQPSQDWVVCPIKVLRKCSSFSQALFFLPKAEETSNLESEEETMKRPRKKFKRRMHFPEEQSDEECSTSFNIDPYHESSSLVQLSIPTTQSGCYNQRQSRTTTPNPAALSSKEKSPASSSQSINGRLLAWMADISNKIQQLQDQVHILLQNQGNWNADKTHTMEREEEIMLSSLPLTSDSSFKELNHEIAKESNLRDLLVKLLISVGGRDMRCHIYNMMRRLLTDEVAELYSLSGKSTLKGTTKKNFLTTGVSKSILVACQKVYKEMGTEAKVKEAMSDWLNQAKVRKLRRLQRQSMDKSAL